MRIKEGIFGDYTGWKALFAYHLGLAITAVKFSYMNSTTLLSAFEQFILPHKNPSKGSGSSRIDRSTLVHSELSAASQSKRGVAEHKNRTFSELPR